MHRRPNATGLLRRDTRRDLTRAILCAACLLVLSSHRASAQSPNYTIGPGDVLVVTVWNEENLTGNYAVDADGAFTFPLIGRVRVGGMTVKDVEDTLRQKLADGFLRKPQVTAKVGEYMSRQIFVVGEVRTPGRYPLTGEMSAIEALARAGSTTAQAGDELLVIRPTTPGTRTSPALPGQPGSSEVTRVSLKNLANGAGRSVALRDGDTIFVPRAESVYVFGQVRSPGGFPVTQGMTVLQALSLAGGITERGSTSRIRIVRRNGGQRVELKAALQDVVLPGDTVIVRERFF